MIEDIDEYQKLKMQPLGSTGRQNTFEPSKQVPFDLYSELELQNLMKKGPDYMHRKLANLVKQENIQEVKRIALATDFILENPDYLESGKLPAVALRQKEAHLLMALLENGYLFPPSRFIKAITEGKIEYVSQIIIENLYSLKSIELGFWLMLKKGLTDQAKIILFKEPQVAEFFRGYSIDARESIETFLSNSFILAKVFKCALENKEDLIACNILLKDPSVINGKSITIAVNNGCIETLQVIWTGNLVLPGSQQVTRAKKSVVWENLSSVAVDKEEKKKINKLLGISSIINGLLYAKNRSAVEKVLDWPNACNENGILRVLIMYNEVGLILKHLSKTKLEISASEFSDAFNKQFYSICLKMLKSKEPRGDLIREKYQSKLITLLESGDTCLQAINMLGFINHRDWIGDLTKTLCCTLDDLISTTDELFVCPSPLLFCVLVIEFLRDISLNSVLNKHRCLECAELFVQQSFHIEKMYKDDDVLMYLLLDTDCRGRSTLSIIGDNDMLELLEDMSVGVIIHKLWKGNPTLHFWNCSSLVQGLFDREDFLAPAPLFHPYSFSFDLWTKSSSLRYFSANAYVLFLLVVYTALIIEASNRKIFLDIQSDNSAYALLRISQIIILSSMCDIASQYIFCSKTKRLFKFDALRITDVLIFGMMLLILAGLDENMGPGKNYPDQDPVVFNGLVHSIVNLLIWIRFLLILIATQKLGPFIYMIYVILQKMFSFYFLFACFTIWFAAVFTALFAPSDAGEYGNFFLSFRTLYSSALGVFSFSNFTDKKVLGCLLLGLYLIITNIILLNLFVALFTTIYQIITERIESTYRSLLVANNDKWKWDDFSGFLIITPTPFSFVGLFAAPFLLYSNNPRINLKIAKIFYAISVGFFQYFLFLIASIVALPVAYVVGFLYYPESNKNAEVSIDEENQLAAKEFSLKKLLLWGFCGLFILMYYIIRDSVIFWTIIFKEHNSSDPLHKFVTKDNVFALHETLNTLNHIEIPINELTEIWAYTKSVLTGRHVGQGDLENAEDFFGNFTLTMKSKAVNLSNLKRLLDGIEEKDLERVQNIRLPYIQKASFNYKNLIGGVEVQGITLPKKVGTPGGPVDVANIKNAKKIVQEMASQFSYFQEIISKVKGNIMSEKFT